MFSEIGKPLKISWAGITNRTCQNNSSGLYAVPCGHISRGMLKTRHISSWINSSGILLLQLSFMSKEPPYHMTGLGIKIKNWSAWMYPLTWEEHMLEDASVLLRGYALTGYRHTHVPGTWWSNGMQTSSSTRRKQEAQVFQGLLKETVAHPTTKGGHLWIKRQVKLTMHTFFSHLQYYWSSVIKCKLYKMLAWRYLALFKALYVAVRFL